MIFYKNHHVLKRPFYIFVSVIYVLVISAATLFTSQQPISASTFSNLPIEDFPQLSYDGEVLATAQSSDGSMYVAGYFGEIDGISRNSVARILTDGSVDPGFNPNIINGSLPGIVHAMKLDEANNTLYITGEFDAVNGSVNRSSFAAFDTTTGLVIDLNISLNDTGRAVEINTDGSVVYVGGEFDTVNRRFQTADEVVIDANSNTFVLARTSQLIYKFDSNGDFVTSWGTWGTGNGEFNYVRSISVDSTGNVYTLEGSSLGDSNRIQKFDNDGNYVSQWGTTGSANGEFDSAYGIGIDADDNIYVADTDNNRIQKFDSVGNYISQFGSFGVGDGQFDQPRGVAIDVAGNIYVADYNNNRIQKFDSSGTYVTQWGSLGVGSGEFNFPTRLFVDASNDVYVLDQTTRVQKFDSSGIFDTFWQVENIGGVTTAFAGDPNNIYVGTMINTGSGTLITIQKFDFSGNFVSQLNEADRRFEIAAFSADDGKVTSFDTDMESCSFGGTVHDIVFDDTDNSLYVAGHFMGFDGETIRSLARLDPVTGAADISFNPDIRSQSGSYGFDQCSEVYDIVLQDGVIYAGGNFDTVNTSVGRNNLASFNTTDGTVASFNPDVDSTVFALAHDGADTLYVGGDFETVNGDQERLELAAFNTGTGLITGFNPRITTEVPNQIGPGYTVYTIHVGNNNGILYVGGTFDHVRGEIRYGLAAFTAAECNFEPFVVNTNNTNPPVFELSFNTVTPQRMAVDNSGNVYVLDSENNQVNVFNNSGTLVDTWGEYGSGPAQFNYPMSIGIDGENNIYIYDDDGRLQKLSSSGSYLYEWEPDYVARDIAVDSNNNIYLLDSGSSVVEVYSSEGDYLTQWGSFGTGNGQFSNPVGIAIDNEDNIYIVEQGNNRVQKLDLNGNFIAEWGDVGTSTGQFTNPTDIAVNSYGEVFVADVNVDGRIQKFSADGTFVAVFGSHGSGDGQFVYDVGEEESYVGLAVDSNNNLFTADYYASKVQKFVYVAGEFDVDNDNIEDIEENSVPNSGDGNGDCIADASQENVSSLVSEVGNVYITIAGPDGSKFVGVTTQPATNSGDSYPFGLFSFVLSNITPGSTAEFNVYIHSNESTANYVAKKYFPSTQTYQNIPGATISTVTIGGQPVIRLTYSITDGSSFDLDGTVNGSITDPAGVAVLASTTTASPSSTVSRLLQNTGNNIVARLIFSACIITIVYLLSRKRYGFERSSNVEIIRNLGSFLLHESKDD